MCRDITFAAAVNSLIQTALCISFGVVAMLMYDCKLTPTPIQISDPSQIPSPLVAFTNSFYLQYFHFRNSCIARNEPYWKDINDTQTGVVTKSSQVHGMFIGYLVENGLWFLCSVLLFFGCVLKSKWIYVTYASTQFTVILYDVILIVLFALDFKSYKMKQPKSSKRNKSGPSSRRPPRDHQPPYEPYQPEPYQPEPFQPHLYPSPYKASRYPDVVSHPPGKFDDSSDEIIVSPAMRYGSPSRNLPSAVSASNYREPRNFEGGRQQAALPPGTRSQVQVPGKSHESVQHPYSSSNRNRMSDRRPSPPRQRHQSRYPNDYQSNISYEGPPANYFDDSDRKMAHVGAPQYHEDRRRQPTSSNQPRAAIASDAESAPNVRFASPIRRESFDRFSNSSDQLKNQRPWSYISPEDLPSSPNKLNQFYNSRIAMSEKPTSRALPALDESDLDYKSSKKQQQQQRQQSEYRKRHSVESRQPLLSQTTLKTQEESPRRHRPAPPIPQDEEPHFYANFEPPMKKNVRFSKRTQSLDILEVPVESPVARRIKQYKAKSPKKVDNKKKMTKEYSSSGEELCTDEFLLFNYNKSPDARNVTVNKTVTELKRAPSSASSPNLVFDPASNTARLVYGKQSNNNKSFQGQQRKSYLNETSI
ncbi:hypothetical protein DAPPUDRAFT_309040 [Daphnia pulex]|uniref:Uncharacterized protein n=1 Tax=Daphnia pulex TaxID=6669 RepID=E9G477_DAPPU|nr:hypothetical protein DAPPUDRAFT_309040 [Daphnia pulex]|eukprot:EFX86060.1 hypothetical protein DAPPUDRAFT_309040 [Daphnia pulex]